MHTHHLGTEDVCQYLADLVDKLNIRKDKLFPDVFCPIGTSGMSLLNEFVELVPKGYPFEVIPINYSREKKIVEGLSDEKIQQLQKAKCVLILDSAIHAGTTMRKSIDAVRTVYSGKIITYSLVIKRGAVFIPNYFGMVMDPHDRAFFLLDKIPNRPIIENGIVRILEKEDLVRQPSSVDCGSRDLVVPTWGDFWYDIMTKKSHVFVYENNGAIQGVLSFTIDGESAFLDLLASDKNAKGTGIGGGLLHWLRCFARSKRCTRIHLWAVESAADFYKKSGYKETGKTVILDGINHFQMEKKLIFDAWPLVG